jgi:hypothetical protein
MTVQIEGKVGHKVAERLAELADIIRQVAANVEEVQALGGVTETRKWGQLSFLPAKARVGTTVRIGQESDTELAMYVHCQTTLVDTYRSLFPELKFSGNRAVLFNIDQPFPKPAIEICVREALLYHLNKKQRAH